MKRTAYLASCLGLLLAADGHAQQPPLTGRMLDLPSAASAAPSPEPPAASPVAPVAVAVPPETTHLPAGIGSTTRALLQLQASGRRAGNALPILGDQARRSHQRYLQSFEHPIPEFFEIRVKDEASGGGG